MRGWSTENDQQEGEFVILCQLLTKGEMGQMMTIDDEEGFHKWQLSLTKDDRTLY